MARDAQIRLDPTGPTRSEEIRPGPTRPDEIRDQRSADPDIHSHTPLPAHAPASASWRPHHRCSNAATLLAGSSMSLLPRPPSHTPIPLDPISAMDEEHLDDSSFMDYLNEILPPPVVRWLPVALAPF